MADNNSRRQLTDEQMRAVELMLEGLTNKGIARRLGVPAQTFKSRLCRLYEKWGVNSRAELVLALQAAGVIGCPGCRRVGGVQTAVVQQLATDIAAALRRHADAIDGAAGRAGFEAVRRA